MDIFRGRPLALASFLFILFLFVSFFLERVFKIVLIFVCILIFLISAVLFVFKKKMRNALIYVILSAVFVSFSSFSAYRTFDIGYHGFEQYVGTGGNICATVEKINYLSDYSSYAVIGVYNIDGKDVDTKMKLECSYLFPYDVGDRFYAEVDFSALEDNINGYHEKLVGISKGQSLVALSHSADSLEFLGEKETDIFDIAFLLNQRLDGILEDMIGKKSSGISRAILLANTEGLSLKAERDMRCIGITHLLALSGMHLTVLIGNTDRLFILLRLPKKPRLFVLLLLTCAYVILTGMQLSMVRSAIMLFMAYLAFWLGRERDMLTSLFFAVALICLVNPGALFDVGLELSFLSMLGITVFGDAVSNLFEKLFEKIPSDIVRRAATYICVSICVTLIATISVLPAVWFYFGETSLAATLGNLILSPFADAILFLSPLVIIFCRIPFVGSAIAFLVGGLSDLMLSICSHLAENRGVMLSLKYPFAKYIVIGMSLVIFILIVVKLEKKRIIFLPVLMGVLAFVICLGAYTRQNEGRINASFVSDGNNDGFAVVSRGRALLCDISSGSYSFCRDLVSEAKALAVCDIEVYMLTHIHDRHIAAFDRMSDAIYVRNVLVPLPQNEDEASMISIFADIAKDKDIDVYMYDPTIENEFEFMDVEIDMLPLARIKRSVQPIVCMSLENNSSRLTYIGASAHESVLYESVEALACESDVLVFGIHGPKYKSGYLYKDLSEKLSSVVFADGEALYCADVSDSEFEQALKSSDISVLPGHAVFSLD